MKKNEIILPRLNEEGKPRTSYSQYNSWKSKEGFNKFKDRSIKGTTEYILQYFLNYEFPPSPMDVYAEFGRNAEDYICERKQGEFFIDAEKQILETITPLGKFQDLVSVDFGEFVLEGFLDDATEDRSIIRDYKTASKSSMKKYFKDDYYQLDIYALDYFKKYNILPEKLEVCIIERSGSHIKPPLTVSGVQYHERKTSEERLIFIEQEIRKTVKEISDCYKFFKTL